MFRDWFPIQNRIGHVPGYPETLKDATTAMKKTLVTDGAMDAYGNIETERFGNGGTARADAGQGRRGRA